MEVVGGSSIRRHAARREGYERIEVGTGRDIDALPVS